MKILLLSSLLLSQLSWATTFTELDQAQIELSRKYQKTLRTAGTPLELGSLVKNKASGQTKASLKQINNFLKSYDNFTLNKIDLFMSETLKELYHYYGKIRPQLKSLQRRSFDEKLVKIEEDFRLYGEHRGTMGQQNDFERTEYGRGFFNGTGKFVNKMKKLQGQKPNRVWGTPFLPFIDNLKEMRPVTGDFLKLLYASYFKTRRNGVNEAPIIDALRKVSKKLAEVKQVRTEWRGLQNFEKMPLDGKTLNLVVFMHANSFYDTSVQGTLKLEGLSSIGNVDIIFPKFLAKRCDKSDHIVAVGHGDIIQKTIDIVKSRRLNKFFIAAEGLTPVGFYEMRPLIDVFALSVYELIKRGIKVNIYPVSFPDNFRMMNDYRRPIEGNKLAYGIVHPVIKTDAINEILKATSDPQALANYIRWVWFKDLINDKTRDIGMPKPTQMKEWLEGMIWGTL